MMFTKREFNKLYGRDKVHIVQAFSPEENITEQEAHKIGIKFAEYFKLKGDTRALAQQLEKDLAEKNNA